MTLAGALALASGAAFLGCNTGERPASPPAPAKAFPRQGSDGLDLLSAGASFELPPFS